MDKIAFIEWLTNQLKSRGWSKTDLARATGISVSHISRISTGEQSPSADYLAAIARAFQQPPEVAFRAAGILPPLPADDLSDELAAINRDFAQLDDEDRQDILDMLDAKIRRKQAREAARRKPSTGHTGPLPSR